MYTNTDKITFGDLMTELKALIFPNGVPENLVGPIDKAFEDAIIDLQRWVPCLQAWHTDVVPHCATYFKCGLTALDKPRGVIRRVYTIQSADFCDPVTLQQVTYPNILCWSRRFIELVDAPENYGLPKLPGGFKHAEATTDSQWGRSIIGKWAIDRERIWIAPWIQSLESVVIEWDGMKLRWRDSDLVPDEQDFKRAVRLFVQKEFARDWERDAAAKKLIEMDWFDARADLIWQCREENRLRQNEPECSAEMDYLSINRTADDNPSTGESTTIVGLIGDYGSNDAHEQAVANLVKSWAPNAIVTLGDNSYQSGASGYDNTVGKYYRNFLYPYNGSMPLGVGETDATANKFWPALGNHDNDYIDDYLAYFEPPGRYYDQVIGPAHFFLLDCGQNTADALTEVAGNTILSQQAAWLRTRIAASTAKWKVVVVHFPPYSSYREIEIMRWDFAEMGADVVISGHNHHYERLNVNGFTYLVCGASGANTYEFNQASPYSLVRYDDAHGALKLSATCRNLTVEFINTTGDVIDSWSLGALATTGTGGTTGGTSGGGGTTPGGGGGGDDDGGGGGSTIVYVDTNLEGYGAPTSTPPDPSKIWKYFDLTAEEEWTWSVLKLKWI